LCCGISQAESLLFRPAEGSRACLWLRSPPCSGGRRSTKRSHGPEVHFLSGHLAALSSTAAPVLPIRGLLTFSGTCLACIRTRTAEGRRELRIAAHQLHIGTTELGAITTKPCAWRSYHRYSRRSAFCMGSSPTGRHCQALLKFRSKELRKVKVCNGSTCASWSLPVPSFCYENNINEGELAMAASGVHVAVEQS